MSFNVLVTVPKLASAGAASLEAAGCRTLYVSRSGGMAEMRSLLATEPVDAVISRTLPLDRDALLSCPTLRVVSRHGVGFDNVDVETATELGIPVLIAPAANGQSVAELAVGLMLAVARGIPRLDAGVRAGAWDRSGSGMQLGGRTLGLVGFGGIGRAVARFAVGLGMDIIAFDPQARLFGGSEPVQFVNSLDELLEQCSVLSLHCPLTTATRGLIGAREIGLMQTGSIIINTARGGLIDEGALAEALRTGRLSGAGLDTFNEEPLRADHPLAALPNIVMTPHMGGSTDAALEAVAVLAAKHALAVLNRERLNPAVCVNPSVLKDLDP